MIILVSCSDDVKRTSTKFVQDVLYYYPTTNHVNAIYIERCNLSDTDVIQFNTKRIYSKFVRICHWRESKSY